MTTETKIARVASYNVLSGGFSDYSPEIPKPERLGELKEAIRRINADFIGLIDTYRWDEIYSEEDLKRMFSYSNAFCINLNDERLKKKGHNNGITVLTNLKVNRFEAVSLGTRDAVRSDVQIGDAEYHIYAVYLDDLNEDARLNQARRLIEVAPTEKTIIMGDLNCIYPDDVKQLQTGLERFLEQYPVFKSRADFNTYFVPALEQMSRAEVIPLLQSRGFIDARGSVKREPTAMTSLSLLNLGAILTIDHIFHTPDISVGNFQVMSEPIFEKASDHYPVRIDIEI